MTYVIDTHPFVWFLTNDARLSSPAKLALQDPKAQLVIPTMVLVEITFLYARRRIALDPATVMKQISSGPNYALHPLDAEVARLTPTTLNIHDAIIVATALVYEARGESTALITKDAAITASGLVTVIW